jgi:adenylate cyclase
MTIKTTRIWDTASTALIGRPELDSLEVARLSGIPNELAARLWQALGFATVPDHERIFTRRDVDVLRFVRHLFDQHEVDPEVFLQMARATGQSLARIANMHALSIAPEIESAVRSAELSESDMADRVAALAETLVESHEPFLGYIWRRHLLAAISQTVASADSPESGAETASIGFADLVDFTTISQQLSEQDLVRLVDRFERIVFEAIPNRGGRVVKMLGD